MFKRISLLLLGLAGAFALETTPIFAQDAPAAAQPESLSLDGLLGQQAAAPAPKPIDPALLTPPAGATADELFAFVEGLQDKLPKPTSQEEMFQLIDAISKAYLAAANQALALADLTSEQRERATQLKVVALTSRANVDADAAKELDAFVEESIQSAKTTDELVKAYQLKLQVLAASEEDSLEKIAALADEMFALEQEELQIFAIEVKAQGFLTATQQTGAVDSKIFEFVDSVIADEARSAKVKEKALEMKLVALVVASELEKEKEEADRDSSFADQAEKLFAELLDGDYSFELTKMTYQIRLQLLFEAIETDETAVAKLEDIVARLAKEQEQEFQALGVSVKGQLLLNAAQKDAAAVPALVSFADQLLEKAKTEPDFKTQAIGLKIQSFRLENDNPGLEKFVDEQLAAVSAAIAAAPAVETPEVATEDGEESAVSTDEDLKAKLTQIKLTLAREAVFNNPDAFAQYESFLKEAAQDEALVNAVEQVYCARYVSEISQIAEKGGTVAELNAVVARLQQDLEERPTLVTALLMSREAIDQIGEKNQKTTLFDDIVDATVAFAKTSKSELLNALAGNLENYIQQMRETEEAEAEVPAATPATAPSAAPAATPATAPSAAPAATPAR